jgi:4-hydroxy-tetrahydrodipicolinate synthase
VTAGASFRPKGIYPILYAFFDERGALDRRAWRAEIEAVIAAGAPGIAILGLITEVAALEPSERRTLVEWAIEDVAGRVPILATVAGRDLGETCALARDAEAAGATALIVQPPVGARPSEGELCEFFADVMAAVKSPAGIQNAPEFLGVGLSPPAVRALADRRSNFTLMKGEGPVAVVKRYVDALSPRVAVLNGRGGLELPDNLRAGCVGLVPAPDCADWQMAIQAAFLAGDEACMDALYRDILPYVVFAMQSLDVAILYGKRMFAARAGIDNPCACRIVRDAPDPFLIAAMRRWSARFGPYANQLGAAA